MLGTVARILQRADNLFNFRQNRPNHAQLIQLQAYEESGGERISGQFAADSDPDPVLVAGVDYMFERR